jgi:hypothetical protein
VLTGDPNEVMPWLATHADVNAIDLTGITDPEVATALLRDAAGTVKRVHPAGTPDWYADPGLGRLRFFLETKTVWHPLGV